MNPFIELDPGKILSIFDKAETRSIEEKWLKIFCKNKVGLSTKRYKWHIFCGEGYPSLEGDDAQKQYESHFAEKYIVMSNYKDNALLTDKRPSNLNYDDVYVFPENYAWTMAFTHEEGWMGPYFAKHKNYPVLEKENQKRLVKLRQIQNARKQGWA